MTKSLKEEEPINYKVTLLTHHYHELLLVLGMIFIVGGGFMMNFVYQFKKS